jgi:hypothetical protein
MPGARTPSTRETDAHEKRLPTRPPGSRNGFTGFLAAIWIVGAVVALGVLFWIAIS